MGSSNACIATCFAVPCPTLEAFLRALGLRPLAACVSEGVDVVGAPPVHTMVRAASSARAVVVAGVLQVCKDAHL